MPTWKVWDDEDLLFEGSEANARQYLARQQTNRPKATLKSPDGDLYRYEDGAWVLQGASGFWGPNGITD
jgi:hypothetical protein